jgi:hypothetical protein
LLGSKVQLVIDQVIGLADAPAALADLEAAAPSARSWCS